MKNVFSLLLVFFARGVSAQFVQMYPINLADSAAYYCENVQFDYYIGADVSGYNPAIDSAEFIIDHGDGTIDTIKSNTSISWSVAFIEPTYSLPGIYTLKFIVTMPDMVSDTSYSIVEIIHCGLISGMVFHDSNSNCNKELADYPIAHPYVVAFEAGTNNVAAICSIKPDGTYILNVPITTNSFDVSHPNYIYSGSSNANFLVVCPADGTYESMPPDMDSLNFGLECSDSFDLNPFLTLVGVSGSFTPGGELFPIIGINSYNCLPINGQLILLNKSPDLSFAFDLMSGNFPDLVSGDSLIWNLNNQDQGDFFYNQVFSEPLFTTSTTTNIGDTICFDLIITTTTAGESNYSNNIKTICQPIVAADDPNFIEVNPMGSGPEGFIPANQEMIYTIHFQNVGTAPAQNIIIMNPVDGNKLNLATLEVLSTSHNLTSLGYAQGEFKFKFDDIYLPDSANDEPGSHGYIMYRIQQIPFLTPGTEIENTAAIYFDYNAPVLTNVVLNTISDQVSGFDEFIKTIRAISIYPNPASTGLTISAENEIVEISIINSLGQIIYIKENFSQLNVEIDVSNFETGIYFVNIVSRELTITEKIFINR